MEPSTTRAAGYLVAGVALLVLIAVFLPRTIGREGSGDSLDPRTWRSRQGLNDRDAEFLADGGAKAKPREKGIELRTRPKGAADHYVAPVKRPEYPHPAPAEARRAWEALCALRMKLTPPPETAAWDAPGQEPPDLDQVVAGLLEQWTAAGGPEVSVRLARMPWAEQTRRARDRARARLEELRGESTGDRALASLAGMIGGRGVLERDGSLGIQPASAPASRDPATRRWLRLAAIRETPGEEEPPAWRSATEQALRERAVEYTAEQESIERALASLSAAAGIPVYLDDSLAIETTLQPVTLRVQKLPPSDVLRMLLDPLRLVPVIEPDGVVAYAAAAAPARQQALAEPVEAAEELLARPVEIQPADLVPYKLASALQQLTGRTVVTDETLWAEEKPLQLSEGARPLRTLLTELARLNRLTWRVYDGELYLAR